MQKKIDAKNEALRKELATKSDLQAEVRALELRLIKWQLGIGFAVIMAKGFGRPGC